MKRLVVIAASVATLATIFVTQATAAEPIQRQVPAAVLGELGLGGLQPLSDESAMTVRGASSFVVAGGGSLLWGQVQFMGQTDTFVAVETNASHSFAADMDGNPSQATTMQGSAIADGLVVFEDFTMVFSGGFSGMAGGAVSPFAGFANAFGQ